MKLSCRMKNSLYVAVNIALIIVVVLAWLVFLASNVFAQDNHLRGMRADEMEWIENGEKGPMPESLRRKLLASKSSVESVKASPKVGEYWWYGKVDCGLTPVEIIDGPDREKYMVQPCKIVGPPKDNDEVDYRARRSMLLVHTQDLFFGPVREPKLQQPRVIDENGKSRPLTEAEYSKWKRNQK